MQAATIQSLTCDPELLEIVDWFDWLQIFGSHEDIIIWCKNTKILESLKTMERFTINTCSDIIQLLNLMNEANLAKLTCVTAFDLFDEQGFNIQ